MIDIVKFWRNARFFLLGLVGVVATQASARAWEVNRETSPLTNRATVSAVIDSEKPLATVAGSPEPASLVLRCREGVIAAYVTWPGYLEVATEGDTLVYWKVDDGAIVTSLWDIQVGHKGGGAYSSKPALKLIGKWRTAHRLVVRMKGRIVQDAVFDLTGIDDVAKEILSACGVADPR